MHEFADDERRISTEEQRRILALASALQERESATLSTRELAQAALEAGIEERHLKRAMSEVLSPEERTSQPLAIPAHAWATAALFISEVYSFAVQPYSGPNSGPALFGAILAIPLLFAVCEMRDHWKRFWLVNLAVFVPSIVGLRIIEGHLKPEWLIWMASSLVCQVATLALGKWIAKRILVRRRPSVEARL